MAQYELNISDYWRIIRRRKWIIFFATAAVLGSVTVFTNMQIPVYMATAMVKVDPTIAIQGISTDQSFDTLTLISTEVKIIKSALVCERTARKLRLVTDTTPEQEKDAIVGSIEGKIMAEKVGDSNLISISATSSDPKETAQLANATAEVYIEKGIEDRSRRAKDLREFIGVQLKDAETKLKTSENNLKSYTEKSGAKGIGGYLSSNLLSLQTKRSELAAKYTSQHPEIKKLDSQIEEAEREMKSLPAEELEYARLERDVKINEELYTLLARRFKEAEISAADRVQSAFIVTPAIEPTSPMKPNKRLNMMIGSFLGVFIGLVLALFIENLDTSIGTIEDVEKFLDLPVLGIIPTVDIDPKNKLPLQRPKKKGQRPTDMRYKLLPFHSSKSPFVEAYHTLRTNLKLSIMKEPGKTLAFTSAGIGEGKTLTSSNFALAAAQSGIKTLLLEADLRRPSLHWLFGLNRGPGFTDCIIGTRKWQDVVKTTTDLLMSDIGTEKILAIPGIENLSIITSGPMVNNPIDILNSPLTSQMLSEMKNTYELIILDCPPALLFADALIVGSHVDGAIIVYQVGKMARNALKRTKDQLVNVKTPLLGVVLNNVKTAEIGSYYGYGYYYSYKYYSKESGDSKTA
jgi:tyrosine-protein kinase Etk/Wzc